MVYHGTTFKSKQAIGLESSLEPKPKDSPIMTENRQPVPAGALEADGERQQRSFWKWAALHFPSRRTGTYDLAKAEEKYGEEVGTHWRDSYGTIKSHIDKSLNLNPPFHKKTPLSSHQTFLSNCTHIFWVFFLGYQFKTTPKSRTTLSRVCNIYYFWNVI